ncbi:MAG: globin-coupled sensor protein [Fimbriimonadales bacterium]
MNMQTNIVEQLRINESNLRQRREFLRLSQEEIQLFRQYRAWAEQIAPRMAREFYDFQFDFPETRQFFEQYALKKGVSLSQLRTALEQAQCSYFLEVFREADSSGEFGVDYFAKRLKIGYVHNAIDLPTKWYIGSYGLYIDLVSRYLREDESIPSEEARALFHALMRIFVYDIQAISDSFIAMLLQDFGFRLDSIQTETIYQDLNDKMGVVRRAFAHAIGSSITAGLKVAEQAETLQEAMAQTQMVVQQIASAIEQVARATTHQAEQTHRAADATRDLTEGIQTISTGAQEQSQAVNRAGEVIQQVGERIRATATKVREMGTHSQRIGEMIEVVNQIAFQTHLLALNAAIEAARAGEAGRGFAVVAKEVQQLAERSAQSAKDVGALVSQIRQAVAEAVQAMEASTQQFEQQLVAAMREVQDIVERYRVVANQMAENAHQVRYAVDEVASAGEQTSAAAQEVSASTQEMSAQSEQIVQWTRELYQVAQELREALGTFATQTGSGRAHAA